jgi:hypothetical protein
MSKAWWGTRASAGFCKTQGQGYFAIDEKEVREDAK